MHGPNQISKRKVPSRDHPATTGQPAAEEGAGKGHYGDEGPHFRNREPGRRLNYESTPARLHQVQPTRHVPCLIRHSLRLTPETPRYTRAVPDEDQSGECFAEPGPPAGTPGRNRVQINYSKDEGFVATRATRTRDQASLGKGIDSETRVAKASRNSPVKSQKLVQSALRIADQDRGASATSGDAFG